RGWDLGGDAYGAKPFSPGELAPGVKAVLRRGGAKERAPGETLAHGRLEMDLARHEVRVGGEKIDLTVTEFGLLHALLERPGRVLTRSQLIDRAYAHLTHITERTIDPHTPPIPPTPRPPSLHPIATVHGLGYKAQDPA